MEPMEARNYRFPKLQLEDLKRMSEERGIKEPELMRRALEEFIAKWKKDRNSP